MSKKTSMLVPPTIGEVLLAGSKTGLPEIEAMKFWNYYESNGWKVGKNRMISWPNALAHWRLVWIDRRQAREEASAPKKSWQQIEIERAGQ